MGKLYEELVKLENFNLIKYTGHYVLSIDGGMGAPIIIQGDDLEEIIKELGSYRSAL